jgi:hypothetical protein
MRSSETSVHILHGTISQKLAEFIITVRTLDATWCTEVPNSVFHLLNLRSQMWNIPQISRWLRQSVTRAGSVVFNTSTYNFRTKTRIWTISFRRCCYIWCFAVVLIFWITTNPLRYVCIYKNVACTYWIWFTVFLVSYSCTFI